MPRIAQRDPDGPDLCLTRHDAQPPLPPQTGRTLDFGPPRAYAPRMARPLRLALQLVLFFMLLAVVIAIAAPETGPLEKGALLLLAAALVWLAWRLRQITTRPV